MEKRPVECDLLKTPDPASFLFLFYFPFKYGLNLSLHWMEAQSVYYLSHISVSLFQYVLE